MRGNRWVVLLLGAALLPLPTARAQTLLRWKLNAGESCRGEMEQQTESQAAFGGKSAASKMNLGMRLRWHVTQADDSAMTVKQTIERLSVSLNAPTGTVEYDSSVKVRSSGLAKDFSEALQPLVGAEIEVIVTPRGEVTSAQPVNTTAKALFAAPPSPADPSGAAESTVTPRNAVQQAVAQAILQLPEQPVSSGDRWTTKQDISTPAGPLQHETTYTLEKSLVRGDKPLYEIATVAKLSPAGQSERAAMRVKSHEQTGTILFSAEEGRVVESEQTQKLVTERNYRDTTIVVTLTRTQKTTFAPAASR